MALILERLAKIKPSPSNTLAGRVSELKVEGRDVFGPGDGEPVFDTQATMGAVGKRSIDEELTRYASERGTMDVR